MADDYMVFESTGKKVNEDVAAPLVNEPYTYENMVSNPIIKPIAETDRSLRDLDDMIYKKLSDIKRLKERVNSVIGDVPAYQDSPFISDLIKLGQSMDDVIKLGDIQLASTKDCIKKIEELVRTRYGVRIGDKEEYADPVTVIPEGSILSYLEKLTGHNDPMISQIANSIKEVFVKTTKGKDDKEKFENAGLEYYGSENDKAKRQIAAKLIRMEL